MTASLERDAAPPLDLASPEAQTALGAYLAAEAGATGAAILEAAPLGGGAIHQHWRLEVRFDGGPLAGEHALVVRAAGAAELAESLGLADEFAVAQAAFEAGVAVPEPLWCCEQPAVLGRPFAVSRHAPGVAAAHLLVRDETLGGPRPALLARLGAELAAIQAIPVERPALAFLPRPAPSPALAAVAEFRAALDAHPRPRPALEWGLRWLERNAPPAGPLVLVHGDYRTGNFLVDDGGLQGILDWEFARWGDPLEDVGWLTARCWRANHYDRPVGGLGPRADFERGYRAAGGSGELSPESVHYWELMAHARWAMIAIHQGERHSSGRQPSLELALTGRIPDEIELEILTMIEEAERGAFGA